MKTKQEILDRMALYRVTGGGIGSWLTSETSDHVFRRLGTIDEEPLSAVQLNQLLVLAHEAPVSDGFFQYYWLDTPPSHPYDIATIPGFRRYAVTERAIASLDHLAWGLHRLYIDGLLYYGNVRTAFRALRDLSYADLVEFFVAKRIDTDAIKRRGPPLPLKAIARDRRYLISEVACKSYGEEPQATSALRTALLNAYTAHAQGGGTATTVADLLTHHLPSEPKSVRDNLLFSASEILGERVASEKDVDGHYQAVARAFTEARRDALENTKYYLSMLTDLDVYVATSMRTREHFIKMASICDAIFSDNGLKAMSLRYFDPTLSAASGHEDKGLIECLMVKCAKALVYCAGEKESYGKDAEAAMALSLGRPVIFYCEERAQFYRDVHPLTRLIQFQTGIAVGAMIVEKLEHVAELLARIFENRMIYRLERSKAGSLLLKEELTESVVRLQTSDELLTETFWNHYHREPPKPVARLPTKLSAPPQLRILGNPPQGNAQGALALEETDTLERLAARSPSSEQLSGGHAPKPVVSPLLPSRQPAEEFPMNLEEIFDGISGVKRAQATGSRRFTVFSTWVSAQGLSTREVIKLLRFIENTLTSHATRASFAYRDTDLSRWFREMSNGDVVGSRA
jgi:hypothetical protein